MRRCASRSVTLSQLRSLFGKRLSCPRPRAPGGSCEQGTVGARGAARQRHVNRVPYWEKRPAFTSDLGRIKSPPCSRGVSDTYWDHGWRRALRSQDAIRRDLCAAWARALLTLSACLPIFAAWAIHCASPEERRRVSARQSLSRQRAQCKFTPSRQTVVTCAPSPSSPDFRFPIPPLGRRHLQLQAGAADAYGQHQEPNQTRDHGSTERTLQGPPHARTRRLVGDPSRRAGYSTVKVTSSRAFPGPWPCSTAMHHTAVRIAGAHRLRCCFSLLGLRHSAYCNSVRRARSGTAGRRRPIASGRQCDYSNVRVAGLGMLRQSHLGAAAGYVLCIVCARCICIAACMPRRQGANQDICINARGRLPKGDEVARAVRICERATRPPGCAGHGRGLEPP